MSDLPDLNTSNIGFLAYWNAIDDGGVSSIDPEDVTSDGSINSYTLYDNGIQIDDYSLKNGRSALARVKSDGWIIVWLDGTTEWETDVNDPPRGFWDIGDNWLGKNQNPTSWNPTTLEIAINSLQSNLSNSGNISFSYGDCGIYNYEYSGASVVTGLSLADEAGSTSQSADMSYTSATDLKAGATTGMAKTSTENDVYSRFAGQELCDNYGHTTDVHRGSYDLLGNNHIPNSGTTYTSEIYSNDKFDGSGYYARNDVIILWD